MAVVVDDVAISTRDIDRMLGGRGGVDGPHVRAHHAQAVEMRMRPVVQQPGATAPDPDAVIGAASPGQQKVHHTLLSRARTANPQTGMKTGAAG